MKKYISVAILFITLCSCSTETVDEAREVDSEIKIVLTQELSEGDLTLRIRSETLEQQPCYNYTLVTDYHLDENNIRVRYEGVDAPEICLTALGPAVSERSFSLENGSYDVEFINDGISNPGELVIDDEKYRLQLFSPVNVVLERETLYKIPENTYWGIIGYHQESSAALAEEFRNELKLQNAIFREYPDGNYGYFEIVNGEMQLPELHGYWFAEPVIFQFDGGVEQLKEIVADFASQHGEEISVGLSSFSGDQNSFL